MKKNNAKELMRVQTLIESDRLNMGKGFNELLVSDLSKLLADYFDFNSVPEIELQKGKGEYRLKIVIYPTRIRALNCLPNN